MFQKNFTYVKFVACYFKMKKSSFDHWFDWNCVTFKSIILKIVSLPNALHFSLVNKQQFIRSALYFHYKIWTNILHTTASHAETNQLSVHLRISYIFL